MSIHRLSATAQCQRQMNFVVRSQLMERILHSGALYHEARIALYTIQLYLSRQQQWTQHALVVDDLCAEEK